MALQRSEEGMTFARSILIYKDVRVADRESRIFAEQLFKLNYS